MMRVHMRLTHVMKIAQSSAPTALMSRIRTYALRSVTSIERQENPIAMPATRGPMVASASDVLYVQAILSAVVVACYHRYLGMNVKTEIWWH